MAIFPDFVVGLLGLTLFVGLYIAYFPGLYLLANIGRYYWAGGVILLATLGMFFTGSSLNVINSLYLSSVTFAGLALVYGVSRHLSGTNIFFLCHFPLLLTMIVLSLLPATFSELQDIMMSIFERIPQKELSNIGIYKSTMESISITFSRLFFVFWWLDLSSRLLFGAWALSRLQAFSGLNLRIPGLSVIGFSNDFIWVMISGLILLLAGMSYPANAGFLFWLGASLLLMMLPVYFVRGCSVLFFKIKGKIFNKPLPLFVKLALILIIFWFWPYLIISTALVGILDTWAAFKQPK